MVIAVNKQTGEYITLENDQWVPAKTARNPKTGERIVLDDGEWRPLNNQSQTQAKQTESKPKEDGYSLDQFGQDAKYVAAKTAKLAASGLTGLVDVAYAPIGLTQGIASYAADKMGYNDAAKALQPLPFGYYSDAVRKGFDEATDGLTAPKTAGERILDAASEALVGGAAPKAMQIAGNLGKEVQAAGGVLKKALESTAPKTITDLLSLSGSGAGAQVGQEIMPNSSTAVLLGALAGGGAPRGAARAVRRAENTATNSVRIAKNVTKGASPEDIIARNLQNPKEVLDNLKKAGNSTLMADVAGDEMQQLMRSVARFSGGPKNTISNALDSRQKAAVERTMNLVNKYVSDKEGYLASLDEIAQTRTKLAKPLYEQSFEAGKNLKMSQRLNTLLQDKRIDDAINTAKSKMGVSAEAPRNSLVALDGAKKVLDDQIGEALRNNRKNEAGSLLILKRNLVNELDRVVPTYKVARKIFEDMSSLENAQKLGAEFKNKSPELVQREFSKLTDTEKAAYRVGVRASLQRIVENTASTGDPAKRIIDRTIDQKRLKAIFPDEKKYGELADKLDLEMKASETRFRVLGGSRTDFNLHDNLRADKEAIDSFKNSVVKGGGIREKIWDIASQALDASKNRVDGINSVNAQEVARILTSKNLSEKMLTSIINKKPSKVRKAYGIVINQTINQVLNETAAKQTTKNPLPGFVAGYHEGEGN